MGGHYMSAMDKLTPDEALSLGSPDLYAKVAKSFGEHEFFRQQDPEFLRTAHSDDVIIKSDLRNIP